MLDDETPAAPADESDAAAAPPAPPRAGRRGPGPKTDPPPAEDPPAYAGAVQRVTIAGLVDEVRLPGRGADGGDLVIGRDGIDVATIAEAHEIIAAAPKRENGDPLLRTRDRR